MKRIIPAQYGCLVHGALFGAVAAGVMALFSGCAAVSQGVAAVGQATGTLTPDQAQAVVKTGEAFGKAMEQITPEQEYYVGRAVGATILQQYKAYNNEAATKYLNDVGQTLAAASDRPETFKGYHFLIMDSEEINAFAAPGGFIFVSRGMLRLCRSEDDLAAVLAHEVGHVQLKHAIGAISNSRWTSAFTILTAEAGKNLGGQALKDLTQAFEGSISDISKKLITSGYARGQERDADKVAVTIMPRLGYNPSALVAVLQNMSAKVKPEAGFGKTHPPPADRIKDLRAMIGNGAAPAAPAARQQRFAKAMAGV